MKIISVFAGALAAFVAASTALACDEDSIQSIAGDGRVIITLSSGTFLVDSVDQVTSSIWLPASDILVCDDEKIINLDDREEVAVSRIR